MQSLDRTGSIFACRPLDSDKARIISMEISPASRTHFMTLNERISAAQVSQSTGILYRQLDNRIPSLPLTTTFPLWKTALRPEVTQPSPLGSSELAGASMVRSGVWRVPTPWKTGLRPEDNVLRGSSSRVRLVVRRVLGVQLTTVGLEGCLWAHSGHHHWWPLPSHLCRLTAASLTLQGA
jgi:hypothetical protein